MDQQHRLEQSGIAIGAKTASLGSRVGDTKKNSRQLVQWYGETGKYFGKTKIPT